MHTFLKYFQAIVSVILIISIMLQNKTSGFSTSSMSSGGTIQTTKRGAEKILFNGTVLFAVLFVLSSIAFLFIK